MSLTPLAHSRQLISAGRTGGFVIFQDIPGKFDACELRYLSVARGAYCSTTIIYAGDVDVWHLETAQQLEAVSVKSHLPGPLRASVVAEFKFGKSTWTVCAVASSSPVRSES